MEELDDYTLIQNGYTIDGSGAIYKGDMYMESVTINGMSRQSFGTEEDSIKWKEDQARLQEMNFTPEEHSNVSLIDQQSKVLYKDDIKKYLGNPESANFTQQQQADPMFQEAFEEVNAEAQAIGEGTCPDSKAMVDASEEGTIYAEIDNEEDKVDLKNLVGVRDKIEQEDKSWKTELEEFASVASVVKSPMAITNIGSEVVSTVAGGIASIIPDTWGMEDDGKAEELEKVKGKIKVIKDPVRKEKVSEITKRIEALEENIEVDMQLAFPYRNYGEEGFTVGRDVSYKERNELESEIGYKQLAITKLNTQRNNLLNNINDKVLDENLFTEKTSKDLLSWGIVPLMEEVPKLLAIKKAIAKGTPLTPGQKMLGEVYAFEGEIAQMELYEPSWSQSLSMGLAHSIGFMRGGAFGRKVGAILEKKILANSTSGVSKFLAGTTNVLIQTAAHPSTHITSAQYYHGDISVDGEGNLVTDYHTSTTLQKELINDIDLLEKSLLKVSDEAKRQMLVSNITEAKEFLQNVKENEPAGAWGAGFKGGTETLKEVVAEQYFLDGLTGVTKFVVPKRARKWMLKTPLANKIRTRNTGLRDVFNKKWGGRLPGQELMHNQTVEFGEELFVQVLPTYGNTYEENVRDAKQIFEWDFISQVLAQTLIMDKGAKGIGFAGQYNYGLDLLSKDKFAKADAGRKHRKFIRDIGKVTLTEDQFNDAFMATGEGSFSMQDYHNTVNQMKKDGDFLGAAKYQKDLIYKQAIAAQKTGNLDNFKKSMVKAQHNDNIPAETKAIIKDVEVLIDNMIIDRNTPLNLKGWVLVTR